MILATCTEKNKGRGNSIDSYTLKDLAGQITTMPRDQLKQAILNKQIDIYNIRLAKDGRLVDREPGYYSYTKAYTDNKGSVVYEAIRRRTDGTVYKTDKGDIEIIKLNKQEISQAMQAEYVRVAKADKLNIKAMDKFYPISDEEYNTFTISEDDYWKIFDIARTKAMQKLGDKPFGEDEDVFTVMSEYIKALLVNKIPRDKAIAFCKISQGLHSNFYVKNDNERLPKWWDAISRVYGFCSDDSYNDYIYGIMALGKQAFYDFYKNPNTDCFKKYSKSLYHSGCELVGYAVGCITKDRCNL